MAASKAAETPPPTGPPAMDIFILSGQSNMAGRGGVEMHHNHKRWNQVVPPQCCPDPSIHRLSAHLRWEEAREPLHVDIDSAKTCGVGPGMVFARAVLATTGSPIGLVPCAVGGTAIREWEKGEKLYEQMVRRARSAQSNGGRIRALLWYQGESDTTHQAASIYKTNMEKLIADVRSDLGLPELPILQVAITSGTEPWVEVVRAAQLGIDLPGVVCVDAKGLPLKKDRLHLTTEAQVRLGTMLADAYLQHFCPKGKQWAGMRLGLIGLKPTFFILEWDAGLEMSCVNKNKAVKPTMCHFLWHSLSFLIGHASLNVVSVFD